MAKTGFIQDIIGDATIWLNPDVLAVDIGGKPAPTDEVNREAARLTEAHVDRLIGDRRTFVVETVLSTDKYLERVRRAKDRGFQVGLTFITLASPELCIERVRQRVEMGGHPVPTDRIVARWSRSIAHLAVFGALADVVHVFDNSEIESPHLVAEKAAGLWHWYEPGRIPALDAVLRSLLGD